VYQNGELLYEEGGDKETASCHLGAGIEAVRRGQRTYYYHPDEQLSTALITDETGTIKNQYRYDAFGAGLEVSEELPNRIRYTGQQYDEITEQYYLRARHYNPILGRFLQEDVYQGDGLNLYAYCRNNPVVYWDPSGYEVTSNPRFNTQQDLELRIKNTPSLKNSYGEWADPNMRGNTDFKVNMSNTDVEYAGLIAAMNAHNTDKVNYSNGMIDLEDFAVFSVDVEISRWRSTTHRRTNKEIARQILEYGGDYDAMFKNNVMGIGSGTLESQRIAKEVINSDAVQNALKVSGSDPRKIREIAKVLNDEKKVYDQVIHETNLELDKTENTTQWVSKEINDKLGHLAGTAEQKQIDNEKNKNKPCNNS
jgi:RHS repeat-associated protein